MSVRVHAIAKQVNKTSKELIQILTERGYDIKSASSTLDNITAQSIIDELSADAASESPEAVSEPVEEKVEKPAEEKSSSKKAPIVRSKADIEEEKDLKKKKLRKQKRKKKKRQSLRNLLLLRKKSQHLVRLQFLHPR